MNKLTRISATVASSLALVAGFSGMASAQGISDSGRNSHNRISYSNQVRTTVRNHNDVHLTNNNPQMASSGDANVNCNDDVNSVSTGQAWNDSQVQADVTLDNSSATQAATTTSGGQGGGSDWSAPEATITDSGRDSNNEVSFRNNVTTSVTNDNHVSVTNNNDQQAYSGNANVNGNDDVSNVTTGDASNTSSATFSVNVTN